MAVVVLATVAAYANSLSAPFQFDDFDQILGNPAVQQPTASTLLLWGKARLIPFLTLALNWHLGGDDTTGYHLVNVAAHLVTALLVFHLALALCDTPRVRGTALANRRLAMATAAALFFACHPIQVQAVTYIVQRAAVFCGMFYVAAVLAFVTARNRADAGAASSGGWYAAAVLCGAGAMLSKENSITLPVALLASEWFFRPRTSLRSQVRTWLPFLGLALLVPLMWGLLWRPSAAIRTLGGPDATWLDLLRRAASPSGPVSPLQYLLTQCTVIPRYLGLVLLPWGFNVDPDVPIVQSLSPAAVAGFVLLAALLALGLAARQRRPMLGFGIIWLFVTLAVESSVWPIGDPMMEHRMYLPMVGVALLAGSGFAVLYRAAASVAVPVGIAVTVLLIALTNARNEIWRTQVGLWADAVAKSPHKARAHANLASFLLRDGKVEEAIQHYCAALAIDPRHPNARRNLEIALEQELDARQNAEDEDGIEVTFNERGEIVFDLVARCRDRGIGIVLPP